ncbi:methionine ABC transporter ATP-binding protein [Microbacterium amylolyticum]|uniref:D-methionine transport system ATP-binding protein n=1 Tax=Microbacterium amylolyticum TaxID=936337 RepID=A0ABS4ZHT6_9MICO|nr:methionine ABC transporter ATP-binding protein [Microbacterium amylolyticum]MBP2436837.1 D-methionine transport system ATP-binding protein [Microbacterium amylolyticum]
MIELRQVSKVYPGGVTALDGVELSISAGEIHGIVGRSGAGKSTLIRCLTGLEPATSGEITIDGADIATARGNALMKARRKIGMVFQHVNLLDSRTAEKNIAHPLEVAGVPAGERRRRVNELLELVGLSDRRDNYPAQLSGGQKQRVGIARALAAEPRVLLCDEPTSALDSATTRQILTLIRSLRDRLGITVVIITHEMSVVREICDSVSLLSEGRIERTGALLDVIRDTDSSLSKELISLPPSAHLDAGETIVEALVSEGTTGVGELFALLGRNGFRAQIAAGTIETIQGHQVGRLHFTTERRDEAERMVLALHEAGVHAELTTAGAVDREEAARRDDELTDGEER